jgi:hypothetical protein
MMVANQEHHASNIIAIDQHSIFAATEIGACKARFWRKSTQLFLVKNEDIRAFIFSDWILKEHHEPEKILRKLFRIRERM